MRKLTLLITVLLGIAAKAFPGDVLLNQVGYMPHFPKFVFATASADSFFVRQASTDNIVHRGKLTLWKLADPSTGLDVYKGDFSTFKTPGEYYVSTSTTDKSANFTISDSVYVDPYYKILKSFYFQRCGMFLEPAYAVPYHHAPCHMNDGTFHSTSGQTGKLVSTGGWHDAGDYGKYVVNAGVTVGTMLMAYETFPKRFGQDDLNIPESLNGVPDILDEVRYELEWLLTMQNQANGGVYAKLTRKAFEGFVMPNMDTGERFVMQIASTATADFAAMMSRAYRVYLPFDQTFAKKCLAAAEAAWGYLAANPSIVPAGGFKNPSDVSTGEYGDGNDRDERLWAAAELFISTGKTAYNFYYTNNYSSSVFTGAMGWPSLNSLAHLTYLFGTQAGKDEAVAANLAAKLDTYCANLITKKNTNGLHVVIEGNDYNWGSNSEVLNRAVMLIMGYARTSKQSYFDAALDQLNYTLGVNVYNMSYVTGMGTKSPMKIHHRPSAADGVFAPVPGLIAGGPNKNISNDEVLPKYFTATTPPAKCYIDHVDSYASNEICINWNAPLVFVAGYFNGESRVSSVGYEKPGIPEEMRIEQNYPNPFNGMTSFRYIISSPQNIEYRIYDCLGNLVEYKDLGFQQKGVHYLNINSELTDGRALSSGIYMFVLKSDQGFVSRKMTLLK